LPKRLRLASAGDINPGSSAAFVVDGVTIAVFHTCDGLYGIEDACPHRGASLARGTLDGTRVTCPWHGVRVDVSTGLVENARFFRLANVMSQKISSRARSEAASDGVVRVRCFTIGRDGDEIFLET
jgi:nitrite reductase/ring-hydroxylating ferredoxin subunit